MKKRSALSTQRSARRKRCGTAVPAVKCAAGVSPVVPEPDWIDALRSAWRAAHARSPGSLMCRQHLANAQHAGNVRTAIVCITHGMRQLAIADVDYGVVMASLFPRYDLICARAAARAILGQLEIFEEASAAPGGQEVETT